MPVTLQKKTPPALWNSMQLKVLNQEIMSVKSAIWLALRNAVQTCLLKVCNLFTYSLQNSLLFYSVRRRFHLNNCYLNPAEPATFIQKLEPSQLFKKDDSVQLECKVAGTLPIKMTWFKNDKEIKESDACSMTFSNSIATLKIFSLSLEDIGEYVCQAKNEAGTDICSCAVIVKGVVLFFTHILYNIHISIFTL